jgi:hypothetical protein
MLELIIINYNMYELICNEYILYNGLSNYTNNEVIKFCIGFYYMSWEVGHLMCRMCINDFMI